MYVVKVGEYYVNKVETVFGGFIHNIVLSKEVMLNLSKAGAERIAKMVNGTVVEMAEEVTINE